MVRFDDVLQLKEESVVVVDATGPLDPAEEEIVEICAWVFQRGQQDAAATEMTTGDHHGTAGGTHLESFKDPDGQEHWKLPLRQVGDEPLVAGDAFGVAVAMLKVKNQSDEPRVVWWGHPLKLAEAQVTS
jgi:hypothetical protein